jgi:hypothetical protein
VRGPGRRTPNRCSVPYYRSSVRGQYLDFKDSLTRGPSFLYNRDSLEGIGGGGYFKIAHPEAPCLSSSAYCLMVEYSRILALYEGQHKLLGKSHNLYWETQGPLTQDQQE